MRVISVFILSMLAVGVFSQHDPAIIDIKTVPATTARDQQYSDVFKLLDGQWKGKFDIYQDDRPDVKGSVELHDISLISIKDRGMKKMNSIDVEQIYMSESPYFQRVQITDYYPESGKKEVSKGVNKIQDGKIWCIVHKPNDTVVHTGSLPNPNTIIWERNESTPQRIEYFKETVSGNTYDIVGWGYYEGDDVSKSPKLWFYASYRKVD